MSIEHADSNALLFLFFHSHPTNSSRRSLTSDGNWEGEAPAEPFTHQARQEPRTPVEIASNSKKKVSANTTYTSFSMKDGDAFSKKFGGDLGSDPDFLRLDVYGYLGGVNTGTSSLYLADYQFSNNSLDFILNGWITQNLAGLGVVDSLQFDLVSTDVGAFGTNTPTYFALDNLSFINITAVPEPTSVAMISLAAIAMSFCRRKKRIPYADNDKALLRSPA